MEQDISNGRQRKARRAIDTHCKNSRNNKKNTNNIQGQQKILLQQQKQLIIITTIMYTAPQLPTATVIHFFLNYEVNMLLINYKENYENKK